MSKCERGHSGEVRKQHTRTFKTAFVATGVVVWIGVAIQSAVIVLRPVITVLSWLFGVG
jgi:hypothetical protein